jgi:hypothetical protein
LSMNGVSRGTISSFTATLPIIGTGECKRRVSRMTASRYGRPAKSSIVGLSVAICKRSLRSLFWISGCCASEQMAHVVPVLVVPLPTMINHHKKGAFEPCPYDRWMDNLTCNNKRTDFCYGQTSDESRNKGTVTEKNAYGPQHLHLTTADCRASRRQCLP